MHQSLRNCIEIILKFTFMLTSLEIKHKMIKLNHYFKYLLLYSFESSLEINFKMYWMHLRHYTTKGSCNGVNLNYSSDVNLSSIRKIFTIKYLLLMIKF